MAFQKLALSVFSVKEVPNLVHPLDWIIVNHWTQ